MRLGPARASARDRSRRTVENAELVARGVAQIGEVEPSLRDLAHAGRVLAGGTAARQAGSVPDLDLQPADAGRARVLALVPIAHSFCTSLRQQA